MKVYFDFDMKRQEIENAYKTKSEELSKLTQVKLERATSAKNLRDITKAYNANKLSTHSTARIEPDLENI